MDTEIVEEGRVTISSNFRLSAKIKKEVATLSGYKCSFPSCEQNLLIDGESFIGQIAAIEAVNSFGPRHNSSRKQADLFGIDNYLLLCPNHHVIVDRKPEVYTVEWLRKAREDHLEKIASILSSSNEPATIKLDDQVEISLEQAIDAWQDNCENSSEEFWQVLFQKCPAILSQIFPQSMFQLGSKCYVGGKSINNSGGNIVDFIYASKLTGNVVLVEIKTPKTKLLGKKYRNNVYSISEDLSGSVIQALNYKDQLMKEYYKLSENDNDFNAFNPKCLVIAGNLGSQLKNRTQYKSFELFRNCTTNVEVITYDELFQRSQDILDIVK